jgi:hypothetical protein
MAKGILLEGTCMSERQGSEVTEQLWLMKTVPVGRKRQTCWASSIDFCDSRQQTGYCRCCSRFPKDEEAVNTWRQQQPKDDIKKLVNRYKKQLETQRVYVKMMLPRFSFASFLVNSKLALLFQVLSQVSVQ